ncbi:ATP-binding cassette domain-containing protein [Salininema proteolyticum]|uniref:ATP-binding cassette domain-containing protein n=1 Tax=Salininema proteolyticum TaxID=1607685 RepID=A0ABV8TWD6_9ACTN
MNEPTDKPRAGSDSPSETRPLPVVDAKAPDPARHRAPEEATAAAPARDETPGEAAESEPADESPYLRADNLKAHGHSGTIVEGLTVSGSRGDLLALSGNSGTGRTTALLALGGRFGLDTGTLAVGGETKPDRIRDLCAMTTATPAVDFEEFHTVREVIAETAVLSRGKADRSTVERWFSALGLSLNPKTMWGHLDAMEKKLATIALTAAEETPVVLVDDVDAGLDSEDAAAAFGALRQVADSGRLVIASCVRADPPVDTAISLR